MKSILSFLFLTLLCSGVHAYSSIHQWMVFKGNYSFVENKVNMNSNLSGSESVTAIVADKNGNTYLAVSGVGLRVFDDKKISVVNTPKESFATKGEILSLAIDSNGVLWIGTTEGLVQYDGKEFINIGSEITGLKAITGIAITATDKVYIAGFNGIDNSFSNGGVAFYNASNWTSYTKANSRIPDDTLQDLTIDKNGYLWMTAGNHHAGIVRFDGKNWKQFHTGNTEQLPTNNVCAITTNNSGNVWFATTKGIVKWDGSNFSLANYRSFGSKFGSYLNSDGSLDVTGLKVEEHGAIWLATSNKGVIFTNGNLTRDYNPSNSLLNSNSVFKIWIDKDDRKWFLTGTLNPY